MKILILARPSEPLGNNVEVLDSSDKSVLSVHQDFDDNSQRDWLISREDLLAIEDPTFDGFPESVELPTVEDEHGVNRHLWISYNTFLYLRQLVEEK